MLCLPQEIQKWEKNNSTTALPKGRPPPTSGETFGMGRFFRFVGGSSKRQKRTFSPRFGQFTGPVRMGLRRPSSRETKKKLIQTAFLLGALHNCLGTLCSIVAHTESTFSPKVGQWPVVGRIAPI